MGLDLSSINGLQTMAEVNAEKRATPKHEMSTAREELTSGSQSETQASETRNT